MIRMPSTDYNPLAMPYRQHPKYDHLECPLTHENTFRFGYNGQWFTYRSSPEDRWMADYEPCRWKPAGFREECVRSARLIKDSTDLPIEVLFSGGMDSQAVVEAFHEAGIPFTVVILRFTRGLNAHDIAYAIDWCEAKGMRPRFIDLDLDDFYAGPAWVHADETYCVNQLILPHFHAVDLCDGFPVIGSGDIIPARNIRVEPDDNRVHWVERKNMGWDWDDPSLVHDGFWYLREGEAIAANYRHFMVRGRPGVPAFFQYTPELMASWLLEPEMVSLINDPSRASAWDRKYDVYKRIWGMKPRAKYDGLEYYWEHLSRMRVRKRLEELYPNSWQYHRTEVRRFLAILGGETR